MNVNIPKMHAPDNSYYGKKQLIYDASRHNINRKVEQVATNKIQLSSINGVNGFKFYGGNTYDRVGLTVYGGDINADGIPDLITSAPVTQGSSVYTVFGSKNPFPATFNVNALNGQNGFRVGNSVLGAGYTVSSEDTNNDGFKDLIYSSF